LKQLLEVVSKYQLSAQLVGRHAVSEPIDAKLLSDSVTAEPNKRVLILITFLTIIPTGIASLI
jgi:hypothetical protein